MSRQRLRVVSPPARQEVAIYARVSSDQQAERHTIDSQLSELNARASEDGHRVREGMLFIDNGHSGASLVRPALARCVTSLASQHSIVSTSILQTVSPRLTIPSSYA